MLDFDLQSLSQSIGILGLSTVALILAYKKIFKDWSSTSAETSVIELMHSELERMSDQNKILSVEIGHLHQEVINLSTQLRKLTVENQRLQDEVTALTNEVSGLRKLAGKGQPWQDHV
jgi:predicted nuclease with TOPRIM domain